MEVQSSHLKRSLKQTIVGAEEGAPEMDTAPLAHGPSYIVLSRFERGFLGSESNDDHRK